MGYSGWSVDLVVCRWRGLSPTDLHFDVQAYTLDHISSLVCGLPPNLYFESEIETVWPRLFEEYENVSSDCPLAFTRRTKPHPRFQGIPRTPDGNIASLFGPEPGPPFDPPCSMYALRVKAMALLARASHFSTSCTTGMVGSYWIRSEPQLFAHWPTYSVCLADTIGTASCRAKFQVGSQGFHLGLAGHSVAERVSL